MYSYPSYFRTGAEKRSGTIKVTGEHTIYVDPDQAIISIGVVTKSEDLEAAQEQNRQISNRAVQSLKRNGISEKDIQTSSYQIFPQYNYEDGKQIFTGYEVRHVLRITVNNLDTLGKIIDDTIKSGANRVENIQFVHSDTTGTYRQALAFAYENAYEKAAVLARQSHRQLNPFPTSITEHGAADATPFAPAAFVKAAEESTSLQPGRIGVTASLTAEFHAN
jgi:uncharacterized protein